MSMKVRYRSNPSPFTFSSVHPMVKRSSGESIFKRFSSLFGIFFTQNSLQSTEYTGEFGPHSLVNSARNSGDFGPEHNGLSDFGPNMWFNVCFTVNKAYSLICYLTICFIC